MRGDWMSTRRVRGWVGWIDGREGVGVGSGKWVCLSAWISVLEKARRW